MGYFMQDYKANEVLPPGKAALQRILRQITEYLAPCRSDIDRSRPPWICFVVNFGTP